MRPCVCSFIDRLLIIALGHAFCWDWRVNEVGEVLAHGALTVQRQDTVVLASAVGTEPHSNLGGSVSTQVLLKSLPVLLCYLPGRPWVTLVAQESGPFLGATDRWTLPKGLPGLEQCSEPTSSCALRPKLCLGVPQGEEATASAGNPNQRGCGGGMLCMWEGPWLPALPETPRPPSPWGSVLPLLLPPSLGALSPP